MDFLYLIFYGCLRLRFLDVETNPGQRRPVPAVCRILCSNVRGLAVNLSVLCRSKMPRARGMAAYVRDCHGAFRQQKFECGCCEMYFFRVCGVRQNLYVHSLYRNPNLDDRIFDCLLASMAAVQAEDIRASLLFVGDLNGHHMEWLGSTTTNRHEVAAFDFAIVSGCDQLVVGPTHASGGTLDLLMTDVPD